MLYVVVSNISNIICELRQGLTAGVFNILLLLFVLTLIHLDQACCMTSAVNRDVKQAKLCVTCNRQAFSIPSHDIETNSFLPEKEKKILP